MTGSFVSRSAVASSFKHEKVLTISLAYSNIALCEICQTLLNVNFFLEASVELDEQTPEDPAVKTIKRHEVKTRAHVQKID